MSPTSRRQYESRAFHVFYLSCRRCRVNPTSPRATHRLQRRSQFLRVRRDHAQRNTHADQKGVILPMLSGAVGHHTERTCRSCRLVRTRHAAANLHACRKQARNIEMRNASGVNGERKKGLEGVSRYGDTLQNSTSQGLPETVPKWAKSD